MVWKLLFAHSGHSLPIGLWLYLCVFLPRIRLAGEDALHEGLGWHPFDWQHGTTTFPIIAGPEEEEQRHQGSGAGIYYPFRVRGKHHRATNPLKKI